MLNFFPSQNALGIDLGESTIRLSQLNNKGQLNSINTIELPDGCIVNGEIQKKEEVTKALKELIKGASRKISVKEAICSLPEKITFLKIIEISEEISNTNNIEKQVISEMAKYIPEEIDKLHIDWQFLNYKTNKLANEPLKIIVGAGYKNIIEQYIKVLDEAGLMPLSLEIESLACTRALINPIKTDNANQTIGILHIGRNSSLFIIYKNYIRLSLVLGFSGDKITGLIANSLNINYEQAEKAKKLCGLDEQKAQGTIKKILAPTILNIAKKIKEIEAYYINYHNGDPLNKLILSGGTANLQGLSQVLQDATNLTTEIGNPLTNIKIAKGVDLPQQDLQSYTASIGLAINGLNISKND